MLNKINNIPDKYLRVDIRSTSIISFVIYYLWIFIYTEQNFQQFSYLRVLFAALAFLILFLFMVKLFVRDFFKEKLNVGYVGIVTSIFIVFVLIVFTKSIMLFWMKPGSYDPFYPLLNAESGLWHRDTAFHVSLIQSILNFGYPSIAENNTPITIYHVLSHYIDAIIVCLVGVQPYDSYGLFFCFKISLYLSSILVYVTSIFRKNSIIALLLSLLILIYLFNDMWGNAVGSEGLWFTSVLLLLSFGFTIEKVSNSEYTFKSFVVISILIITISIGKVSTGFMYASFIGFLLLFNHYRNKYVYVTGIIWLIFFYFFQKLLVGVAGGEVNQEVLSLLQIIEQYISYFIHPSFRLCESYILLFIIFIQSIFFRKNKRFYFFLPAFLTLMVLGFVVSSNKELSTADIMYFEIGYNSILSMLVIYMLINQYNNSKSRMPYNILLVTLLLLASHSYLAVFSNSQLSIRLPNYYQSYTPLLNDKSTLYGFRNYLYKYMQQHNLTKRNSVLYIPKEIYNTELEMYIKKYPYPGNKNWTGMLIYAINGVPLLYGANSKPSDGYGYIDYGKSAQWVFQNDFDTISACNIADGKTIIVVDSYINKKLDLIRC
ncbi:hypothetical protein [Francisella philomiragia]|uniref:hypothetical protein n=1 Tax=Francisella philomiragia TaxID=28110 RepID=UPI003511EDE8